MEQTPNFPPIPLIWVSTDVPDLPFELPAPVVVRIEGQNLVFVARRASTASPAAPCEFLLHRASIQEVGVRVGTDLSPRDIDSADLNEFASIAMIRHSDPLQVVPFFQSQFISPKSYWIKALVKLLGDQFNSNIVNLGQGEEIRELSAKSQRRSASGFVRNLRRILSMG